MARDAAALDAPVLDRTGDSWIGTFPGLGRVVVDPSGGYRVEPDRALAGDPAARDALEFGWAEPLSLVRRGLRLAAATTMVPGPPVDAGGTGPLGALMISGRVDTVAQVALGLAGLGWRLVSDGFTPIATTPALVAHPRRAPWIAPRHLAGLTTQTDGPRLRPGATAQRIDSPRHDAPVPVAARLAVVDTPLRSGSPIEPITGRHRMGARYQLLGPGPLGIGLSGEQAMAEEMSLASVPMALAYWPAESLADAPADAAADAVALDDAAHDAERSAALDRLQQWWTDATA
jgi:hypothetical protein